MNIVCIGSGYVGSVTGAAFATLGHRTMVLDIDVNKVALINSGKSPIYEPGLDELISAYVGNTLFATNSYDVIREADVVFIGVGTPSKPDGTADLKYIKLAAQDIGKHLNPDKFTVIVNKSTVPVGTADLVATIIEEHSKLQLNTHFAVVSNPEFLREGFALEDVFFPDRIVIGVDNERARKIMHLLYQGILNAQNYDKKSANFYFDYKLDAKRPQYFETDIKSAEMIKYASNAFLAVKISYINEMARLCEVLGANIMDVSTGMGLDSRIGNKFLQVSSGWSGSCFPKDTAELLATSRKYGCELGVVEATVESNLKMHSYVVDKIKRKLQSLNGKTIGILGLTFKPNTDDARNTQASVIIRELVEVGARVKVHDPQGMEMFRKLNSELDITYCDEPLQAARQTDAIVLLTHWDEYTGLKWHELHHVVRTPYILDTRNFLNHRYLREIGFDCEGLGISSSKTSDRGNTIVAV